MQWLAGVMKSTWTDRLYFLRMTTTEGQKTDDAGKRDQTSHPGSGARADKQLDNSEKGGKVSQALETVTPLPKKSNANRLLRT